ncbi:MAG: hypothetical protein ABI947_18610 [Chloroflexota bacterium]
MNDGQRFYGKYDTQSVLEKCKGFLKNCCGENDQVDLRPIHATDNGHGNAASLLYIYVAWSFIAMDKFFAAEELLLDGWDTFNAIQSQFGCKVYKGQLANGLVIFYEQVLGDIGTATRWALLTHADDALVQHDKYGEGTQKLRYRFGMSKEALDDFNEIIHDNILYQRINDWNQPNRFADDQLVRFVLRYPQHAHLFAHPTSTLEIPPCIPYLT